MIERDAASESAAPSEPRKCSRCGAATEEGFVVDFAHNGARVSSWISGKPQYGIFGGTKVWSKEQYPIQTFCCTECGYLESYVSRR